MCELGKPSFWVCEHDVEVIQEDCVGVWWPGTASFSGQVHSVSRTDSVVAVVPDSAQRHICVVVPHIDDDLVVFAECSHGASNEPWDTYVVEREADEGICPWFHLSDGVAFLFVEN